MTLVPSKSDRNSTSAKRKRLLAILPLFLLTPIAMVFTPTTITRTTPSAVDPGVRGGVAGAGGFVSGLTPDQVAIEAEAKFFFEEVNVVAGGRSIKRVGLGARFDHNGCAACHKQPNSGGSSLPVNPLFDVYQLMGAQNTMPFFETPNGPTLVARFPYQSDLVTPDGHVHQLFTITGRTDAEGCNIQQPDFDAAYAQGNLIFRNTTPFFGGGMMEIIQDADIIANMSANQAQKAALGITGHPNLNSEDGSVNRFGWKAQKRSLLLFAGEAYNVENGNSNEFFPNKLDETPGCTPPMPLGPPNGNGPHGVPDDRTAWNKLPQLGFELPGDPERFAIFGRILAPPKPGACPGGDPNSCINGQTQFNNVGCVLCHTTSFTTPPSSIAALGGKAASLFSDLLVHHMGPCLADNITQGDAVGDEFRTAPLWGVGQRVFFIHDGRTADIVQAIEDHFCVAGGKYGASEANGVVQNFEALGATDQQDLINFLRSL